MQIGLPISLSGMTLNVLYAAILGMFAGGVQGAFLDANDWGPTGTNGTGVCFQDMAGTSVTAMEQPIQLILDKSQNLALGSELVTNGGPFTNTTGWTPNYIAGGINPTLSAVGGQLSIANSGGAIWGLATQTETTVVGKWYKVVISFGSSTDQKGVIRVGTTSLGYDYVNSPLAGVASPTVYTFYFLATTTTAYISIGNYNTVGSSSLWNGVSVKAIAGNHACVSASANRPIISARYNLLTGTAVLSTQSVTVGAGSHVLAFSGAGSVALSGAASGTKTAGSNTITCTAGTLTLTVTGTVALADLRPADQANGLIPPYQAVVDSTHYDWSPAFPPIIKGNGSNQYLTTGNIDFSGTSRLTVWAGVRKNSDASRAILMELGNVSASYQPGSFSIYAPFGTADFGFYTTGLSAQTANKNTGSIYPAPITDVLSCAYDLSTSNYTISPRVNGVVPSLSGSNATGAANFGVLPLNILGRNQGASLCSSAGFNTIIVVGKQAANSEIILGEQFANLKLKAA